MIPTIRPETPADIDPVSEVNRLAFARDGEADLVDALRDGGYVRLSLVAEVDGQIVGHILFSRLPVITDKGVVEALALAPMAVLPSHQRRGIGTKLVQEGLRLCAEREHRIVVVLGHPKLYPRFGFTSQLAKRLDSPYSGAGEAWMALELVPGALAGVVGRAEYPPPFAGG
jgi:putative acetyltransferase